MVWIWTGFVAFVLALLALDLGVFHRKAHVVRMSEALAWSGIWVALGLSFTAFIYFGYEHHWLGLGNTIDAVDGVINDGTSASIKYLTGYILEKSLSVDNIFVIAMLFGFFAVPAIYQHRVLFWGIVGALVMRAAMIGIGTELISRFHWILYVFGAVLIATAIKMLLLNEHKDPGKNIVVRAVRKFLSVTDRYDGQRFFTIVDGRRYLTPLMLALIMVEATDVVFAVDSIPAIFAVTADPFLVFTSNVFAILGLRSLYFALAGMVHKFRYLKLSLALILAIVGTKMLAAEWLKAWFGAEFSLYLLGVIAAVLATGIVASLLNPIAPASSPAAPAAPPHGQAASE